ncbi:outer membrane lipoprotein carrier protein LolA [Viridibacillus arvi]|uniref:LolA family protein n=1 Tax=Viridibacillus arvi TaxID=263475 RepID=UPI0036C6CF56
MGMKTILKTISLVGIITIGLVGCSTAESQFSPEQVIQNTLKDSKPVGPYYGEYDMTISNEKMHVKEWIGKDSKRRIEISDEKGKQQSLSVNDGENMTSYDQAQNTAIVMPITDELKDVSQSSPKEQAELLLKAVKGTHDISLKGEEKVLDRKTYHLVAKGKGEKTLFGDMEIWVDKENWMVLKTNISTVGGDTQMEYTKIDFDAKIPDSTFTLDLPKDAKIQKIDSTMKTEQITSDELPSVFEKAFLYFPEKSKLKMVKIEVMDVIDHKELAIEYEKDGVVYFSLSVFPTPKDMGGKIETIPGEKQVKVRGQKGSVIEMDNFRSISWSEKGFNYSIMPTDPNLKVEELLKMAKGMKLVK